MVTGSTGYVAGWLVKKLLDEGYSVHAPVRDLKNQQKLHYLNQIAKNSPGTITYFEADLLQEGSYLDAMQECEIVFHTASPFINKVADPQRDLIDLAFLGTRNVLDSVNKTESVKRVVLTSSCAAIIGDARDLRKVKGGVATESNWNETSSLAHQPYSFSKTVAEREAWKINKAQNRWRLVVINPSLVIGPGINPKSTSESLNIVKQLADGTMKMGVPALNFGMVDVRDLADAHFKAGFLPHAEGRHIISAEHYSFLELAKVLRTKYGKTYPFPTRELPKWLIWLAAPAAGIQRSMIARNVGYNWRVDNSKSIKSLGVNYRPVAESITDFFAQLVENKMV